MKLDDRDRRGRRTASSAFKRLLSQRSNLKDKRPSQWMCPRCRVAIQLQQARLTRHRRAMRLARPASLTKASTPLHSASKARPAQTSIRLAKLAIAANVRRARLALAAFCPTS
eukprot:1510894-Pleurochrysis_carterae.AAC.1